MARGSQIIADVYLRRLSRFCDDLSLSSKHLADMEEGEVTNLLDDYIRDKENMTGEGKPAGSYLISIVKIIRSWLSYNGKDIKRRIKVMGAQQSPTLKGERVPTQDELRTILNNATVQSRVTCSLMAFSGLRPQVLGNYDGNDSLRIKDVVDLEIKGSTVSFKRIPAMVIVREELSKSRKRYFTFLGQEGCRYLKEYLEFRMNKGEKINRDSPVITSKNRGAKPFISTNNIGDQVKKAIRLSGMEKRPYVLRGYFDTQLMLAESKGLIMRDYRQFFMGHVGDIEHRYTLDKSLPENTVKDMREAYLRSTKYLETEQKGVPEEDLARKLREFAIMLLETQMGLKLTDKQKENLYSLPVEKFQEELKKLSIRKKMNVINNGNKQKVVSLDEVESFIEKGWEYVNILPGNKAIIKLPEKI